MSKTEREAFLADVHVGVMSVSEVDRGPLTVPIWYTYVPGGEVRFVTGRESRKATLLRDTGRFTLCVQTETAAYKYVSVEGPIIGVATADVDADIRPLAHRYVAAVHGGTDDDSIVVRMLPERWLSADFAKEFGSV